MSSAENRVAIVTGGSRGIGRAVALLLAERGYAVCLSYVSDAAAAQGVVDAIAAKGGRALAVKGDVGNEADVIALFKAADGLGRLAALVNNAGVVDVKSDVADMSVARLQRMMTTNVVGSFLCAREAVRRMSIKRGGAGGAIVNLSSVAARLGGPGQFVDYAASKGAIDSLTIGLSREVAADGIRVNAVAPGIIATEIHASGGEPDRVERLGPGVPMKRAGTAEEVAAPIVWLLSDEASYTTGAILDIGGGR
ncbi:MULTISPECIES: SDR family oxidoreductase [Methylobacterium]|jgi:NAD(P)-dependent dehydrogenase (short-subunit alcohol dehydrogenase family)|uniref:SDR family oxidoreductase n=1 Tax=Methylobacterium TaxID=407 RepID=UPI00036DB291|nr:MULTISPECIES: SDR family oxidoreductase [Methylobacterium]KQS81962.1 sugar dehydrogenase [Methylobacterium sp. Leaf361]MBN4094415.1 SDR family oxidoreductase [Methylobacterium sp. OT2]UIN33169.1 SDR family oxidoreductase [Methylobacterium oryzae]SEG24598.1 NAD(P)-dependent dehydrogenase, short-chain alcohol dehydrogenase family [Methylobacterium sp. 190mf]SEH75278.1 NAD(P)-dependent dehydrogenase, short-chain alcohol dehydrogenase family [Methylobacterium sp. 275MFSha3.1]